MLPFHLSVKEIIKMINNKKILTNFQGIDKVFNYKKVV